MPRFYFDFWEDEAFARDEVGIEFPSAEAAKAQALATLPAIAEGYPPQGDHKYLELRMRDGTGRYVLRVSLALVVEVLDESTLH